MKINSVNNFISFGKQLVATGDYLKEDKVCPCFFYKLCKDDKLQIEGSIAKDEWQGIELVDSLVYNMNEFSKDEFYSIEDSDGMLLGATEIYDEKIEGINSKNIHIIETCPKCSSKNIHRKEKYIGESLLAFIVKLAKKENKEMVYISVAEATALSFYTDKCFFTQRQEVQKLEDSPVFLMDSDFDKLIDRNEEHTKNQIKFV